MTFKRTPLIVANKCASPSNWRDVKTDGDRDNVGDDYSTLPECMQDTKMHRISRRDFRSAKIYYNNIVRWYVWTRKKIDLGAFARKTVLHFFFFERKPCLALNSNLSPERIARRVGTDSFSAPCNTV